MKKNKAIPHGYMTVGELAKKMNTTVRTLQYYDKENVLSPSAESKGGRRLYTDKDIIKLHQIQSLKFLGFSLKDIKNRLSSLENPEDVATALTDQAKVIQDKIDSLSEALEAIEKLKEETLQMDTVDFRKYADIIMHLQAKNEHYWVIKHFDDKLLNHVQQFDQKSGQAIINTWQDLCDEVIKLQQNDILPDSDQGQILAQKFWDMITDFTGGDMSLLPEMMKFSQSRNTWDTDWKERWEAAETFMENALEVYFTNLGWNPLEEVSSHD